jgi:hypothetical protein
MQGGDVAVHHGRVEVAQLAVPGVGDARPAERAVGGEAGDHGVEVVVVEVVAASFNLGV